MSEERDTVEGGFERPRPASACRRVFRRQYVAGGRGALWLALTLFMALPLTVMTVAFPRVLIWIDIACGGVAFLLILTLAAGRLVIDDEGVHERSLLKSRLFRWGRISYARSWSGASDYRIGFFDARDELIGHIDLALYRKKKKSLAEIARRTHYSPVPVTIPYMTQLNKRLEHESSAVKMFSLMWKILYGEPRIRECAVLNASRMIARGKISYGKDELLGILNLIRDDWGDKKCSCALEEWYMRYYGAAMEDHINNQSNFWKPRLFLAVLGGLAVCVKYYHEPGRINSPVLAVLLVVAFTGAVYFLVFLANKVYVRLRFGKALKFLQEYKSAYNDWECDYH